MSFQSDLVSVCGPVFAGCFYDHVAPQPVPGTPYAVYSEIASQTENTLSDGIPINQSLIQIDVYHSTYAGADSAARSMESAIQTAFAAGVLTGVQRSRRTLYEPEVKMRRIIYEFSFWYH